MRGFGQGRIIERIDLTPELMVFRVETEHPIPFVPGQFVRLGLEVEGRLRQRSYTIVSAPGEPYLEFLLELVPEGLLTPHLWKLHEGDHLLIHSSAAGVFTLDRSSGIRRHLMIATVTGIAPYVSMIRSHARALQEAAADDLRFLILHGGSRAVDLEFYRRELEKAAEGGWLLYIPTISQPWEEEGWSGETGNVEDLIRKYADTHGFVAGSARAYACGHPLMVENAREILMRGRFGKGEIAMEKYFPLRPKREEGNRA